MPKKDTGFDEAPFAIALSNGFKAGVAGSLGHDEMMKLPTPEIRLTWKRGYEAGRRHRLLAAGDMDEHKHQCLVFGWAECVKALRPDLDMLFAVPNAGKRTPRQGAYMKAEGLQPGFPDIGLLTARFGRHGLFIELKKPKGRVSPEQAAWIDKLEDQNYKACVRYGWLEAIATIEQYLDGLMP